MNQHIRYEWTSLICNPVMLQHVHSEKFFYDTAVSEEAVTGHGVQIMFFLPATLCVLRNFFFTRLFAFSLEKLLRNLKAGYIPNMISQHVLFGILIW